MTLKAIVGDDLQPQVQELKDKKAFRKFTMEGEDEDLFPEDQMLMSCNAYLHNVKQIDMDNYKDILALDQ
jgi:hypothetical protein